jgi:hypothetical protein
MQSIPRRLKDLSTACRIYVGSAVKVVSEVPGFWKPNLVARNIESRLPVFVNHFPISSSLSAYTSALGTCDQHYRLRKYE